MKYGGTKAGAIGGLGLGCLAALPVALAMSMHCGAESSTPLHYLAAVPVVSTTLGAFSGFMADLGDKAADFLLKEYPVD